MDLQAFCKIEKTLEISDMAENLKMLQGAKLIPSTRSTLQNEQTFLSTTF